MHCHERRHRSVEILGRARMSQPDDRGLEILNVPSEARSAEGWCLGSGFCSPKFKSKSGASSPPFLGSRSPTFGLNPVPLPLRAPFLFRLPFMALSAPYSYPFSVLRFPMLYPLFPLRSLLPFSFFPLPFPEGPHTQLEGLASQVL